MKVRFAGRQLEVPEVYSFRFEPLEKISWQAGQYLHYELPHADPDERGEGRWFTISSAPFEKHLQITTRIDAEHSSSFKKALFKLEPGTEVETGLPRGDFVYEPAPVRLVLVAGGIGITPYRSILTQLDHNKKPLNVDLLWAMGDQPVPFLDEIDHLAGGHSEFKLQIITGRRLELADFQDYIPDENTVFYLSGPEPLVMGYEKLLKDSDVSGERIKLDYFPGYTD